MSGERFSNSWNRRAFLKAAGSLAAATLLVRCGHPQSRQIPVTITGNGAKTGHLLRDYSFPAHLSEEHIETLIVGGGISGLSAARWLKRNGHHAFRLVELEDVTGGNSRGGKNSISAYPYAAHYLPVPDTSMTDLMDFLKQHDVITGFDSGGLPVYNEYFLCADPQERLFYRGMWMDGLLPGTALNPSEAEELKKFLAMTESYKNQVGKDGRPAFAIPVARCSTDEEFMTLDRISIGDFLKQEGYRSEFLEWYLDYCCKDDYGCGVAKTSAWAAIHYFASRKGLGSNANSLDVLTWPEGNHFLASRLNGEVVQHVSCGMLTYKIERSGEGWHCYVYDVDKKTSVRYNCRQVIMATPQFVNKRILGSVAGIEWEEFKYYPWIVANISVTDSLQLNGRQPLSWDNVFYKSASLGYVNANHQDVRETGRKAVLTYYYNFSGSDARTERKRVREYSADQWKQLIMDDLRTVHNGIENIIENIEVNVLGHGMIAPEVNFLSRSSLPLLKAGLGDLYFAHSDISGISIFEEAFYQGIRAAKQVLSRHHG